MKSNMSVKYPLQDFKIVKKKALAILTGSRPLSFILFSKFYQKYRSSQWKPKSRNKLQNQKRNNKYLVPSVEYQTTTGSQQNLLRTD